MRHRSGDHGCDRGQRSRLAAGRSVLHRQRFQRHGLTVDARRVATRRLFPLGSRLRRRPASFVPERGAWAQPRPERCHFRRLRRRPQSWRPRPRRACACCDWPAWPALSAAGQPFQLNCRLPRSERLPPYRRPPRRAAGLGVSPLSAEAASAWTAAGVTAGASALRLSFVESCARRISSSSAGTSLHGSDESRPLLRITPPPPRCCCGCGWR